MLPLANRRILITRAAGQASKLASLLEAQGAETILIPTIEIAPPASWCALDAALSELRSYDWLVFTSANAVHAFVERARTLGVTPYPRRIAVIGPATTAAVHESGLVADMPELLMPERFVAESLAEALLPHAVGARMLLVRAAAARDVLPETLADAGATVTIAEAYRTIVPKDSAPELRTLFATNPPDAITFTSASTVNNLAALLGAAELVIPDKVTLASIGPITSQALREVGLVPTVEAQEATIPSLVEVVKSESQRTQSKGEPTEK